VTGYTALYWAWMRGNLEASRPYLSWARNFGMLAVTSTVVALGILFSSKTFPVPPKTRLLLSLLATTTIGFFPEFRNEGKFCLNNLHHFFGPGTWIHASLNQGVPSQTGTELQLLKSRDGKTGRIRATFNVKSLRFEEAKERRLRLGTTALRLEGPKTELPTAPKLVFDSAAAAGETFAADSGARRFYRARDPGGAREEVPRRN